MYLDFCIFKVVVFQGGRVELGLLYCFVSPTCQLSGQVEICCEIEGRNSAGVQLMKDDMARFVTINDSRLVASGKLQVGSALLDFNEVDFGEFRSTQRKVIVGWSGEERARYSSAVRSREISTKEISINDESGGRVILDLGCERLILGELKATPKSYQLYVSVSLEIPLEAFGDMPDHIKPLLQYSEIVRVTIDISCGNGEERTHTIAKRPVYDGYGDLGFFIADLNKMNEYIVSRLGSEVVNLKDAFCETEIANELFAEGLLVLVWGMTPWHYYLYGVDEPEDAAFIPRLFRPQFQGAYRLRRDIKNPSVVPGEFLLNWPECMAKEFPTITVAGDGGALKIEVNVMGFYVPNVGIGPPLSVIIASREDGEPKIEPLLMVDIEAVEPGLCF